VAYAAAHKGVVSILAEAGGNGEMTEADISLHSDGVRNVMRYIGMMEGKPVVLTPRLLAIGWHNIRAGRSGLLRLKVGIGDKISEGQEVAEVCDVFGRTVETIRATKVGLAMLVWSHKAVNTGDPIVRCWTTETAPPFHETDRYLVSHS
jgi:predicted deacylase